MITESDTITRIDSIHDSIPYPVVEKITEIVPEPFPQYVTLQGDTIRDTVYVNIPITQKEYKTDLYHAYVSGYKLSLDSITVYSTTEYVTRTVDVKPRRFGIGVIGGYGIGIHGASPYIGIGCFYRIW